MPTPSEVEKKLTRQSARCLDKAAGLALDLVEASLAGRPLDAENARRAMEENGKGFAFQTAAQLVSKINSPVGEAPHELTDDDMVEWAVNELRAFPLPLRQRVLDDLALSREWVQFTERLPPTRVDVWLTDGNTTNRGYLRPDGERLEWNGGSDRWYKAPYSAWMHAESTPCPPGCEPPSDPPSGTTRPPSEEPADDKA